MKISKIFTQKYEAQDCEGHIYAWEDTTEDFDTLKGKMNGWCTAIRIVEKTFDSDTFLITETPIKVARRVYTRHEYEGYEVKEEILKKC